MVSTAWGECPLLYFLSIPSHHLALEADTLSGMHGTVGKLKPQLFIKRTRKGDGGSESQKTVGSIQREGRSRKQYPKVLY